MTTSDFKNRSQEQMIEYGTRMRQERDRCSDLLAECRDEIQRLTNALREIRGGAKACVAEGQGSICRGQRRAEEIAKTVLPKTAYERVLDAHSESSEA